MLFYFICSNVHAEYNLYHNVDVLFKGSKNRQSVQGALFSPWIINDQGVFFSDLRFVTDLNKVKVLNKSKSKEGNLGIGYRYVENSETVIGGFIYYDIRDVLGEKFNQITLNAHLLTPTWQFFTNGYIALGDKKKVVYKNGDDTGDLELLKSLKIAKVYKGDEITYQSMSGVDVRASSTLGNFDKLRVGALGYYFTSKNVKNLVGGGLFAEFNLNDYVELFSGVDYNKQNKTSVYGGVRLSLALGKSESPSVTEKLLMTKVYRDIDIVVGGKTKQNQEYYKPNDELVPIASDQVLTTLGRTSSENVDLLNKSSNNVLPIYFANSTRITSQQAFTTNKYTITDVRTILNGSEINAYNKLNTGTSLNNTINQVRRDNINQRDPDVSRTLVNYGIKEGAKDYAVDVSDKTNPTDQEKQLVQDINSHFGIQVDINNQLNIPNDHSRAGVMIVNKDSNGNPVVLLGHDRNLDRYMWASGGKKNSETGSQTAIREFDEESHLQISEQNLKTLAQQHGFVYDDRSGYKTLIFIYPDKNSQYTAQVLTTKCQAAINNPNLSGDYKEMDKWESIKVIDFYQKIRSNNRDIGGGKLIQGDYFNTLRNKIDTIEPMINSAIRDLR